MFVGYTYVYKPITLTYFSEFIFIGTFRIHKFTCRIDIEIETKEL